MSESMPLASSEGLLLQESIVPHRESEPALLTWVSSSNKATNVSWSPISMALLNPHYLPKDSPPETIVTWIWSLNFYHAKFQETHLYPTQNLTYFSQICKTMVMETPFFSRHSSWSHVGHLKQSWDTRGCPLALTQSHWATPKWHTVSSNSPVVHRLF